MKKILSFTLGLFTLFTSGVSCLAHTAKIYSKMPGATQGAVRYVVVDGEVYSYNFSESKLKLKYLMEYKDDHDTPRFYFYLVNGQKGSLLFTIKNSKLFANRLSVMNVEQCPESFKEVGLGNLDLSGMTVTSQGMTFLKMENDTVYYCPVQEYTEASKIPIFRVEGKISAPMIVFLAIRTLVLNGLYKIMAKDGKIFFHFFPI